MLRLVRCAPLQETGRLAEARAELQGAIRSCEENGDLAGAGLGQGLLANLGEALGDLALARSAAERASETVARTGALPHLALAERSRGLAALLANDARQAAAAFERSLELARCTPALSILEPQLLAFLARANALLGDPAAREEARAAVRLLGGQASINPPQVHLDRARVLRILDGAAAHREIADALREAERLAREQGYRGSLPFVHQERAELARLLGDEAARVCELREAGRLFHEIGAPLRAEQVEQELRESVVRGTAP